MALVEGSLCTAWKQIAHIKVTVKYTLDTCNALLMLLRSILLRCCQSEVKNTKKYPKLPCAIILINKFIIIIRRSKNYL